MKVTPEKIKTVYDENNAIQHYLSKNRRDGVKVVWEEPFSRFVFAQAIAKCGKKAGQTLRVMDVGAGIGDGYELLRTLFSQNRELGSNYQIEYLGVDISPDMVNTANELYQTQDNVSFKCSDIRTCEIDQPFDLYLSCGVPYSHLTEEELIHAIQRISENICKYGTRSAVVIDVLGHYSIEWIPKWGESRWDYAMSFFESEGEKEATWMSFYSHEHLREVMLQATDQVGCSVEGFQFFDRSIMVGRHTSTQQFNPQLKPYRNLINSLLAPQQETDLSTLLFDTELGEGPSYILDFFTEFRDWWNSIIAQIAQLLGQNLDIKTVKIPLVIEEFKTQELIRINDNREANSYRQELELLLAKLLAKLEATQYPGYGVGHDLFGLMWIDGTK